MDEGRSELRDGMRVDWDVPIAMDDGIVLRAAAVREALAARRPAAGLARIATWPIYRGDAVLRRATALNAHPLNRAPAARLNATEAARLGVADGATVHVGDTTLPVVVDRTVPDGAVWIEAAQDITATLPPYGAAITLGKA